MVCGRFVRKTEEQRGCGLSIHSLEGMDVAMWLGRRDATIRPHFNMMSFTVSKRKLYGDNKVGYHKVRK
jgi:hypothetical protein